MVVGVREIARESEKLISVSYTVLNHISRDLASSCIFYRRVCIFVLYVICNFDFYIYLLQ